MIFYLRGTKLLKIQIIFLAKQCCYSSSSQQKKKPKEKKNNTVQLGLSLFNYCNWSRHKWISCKLILTGIHTFNTGLFTPNVLEKNPNKTHLRLATEISVLPCSCDFTLLNNFPLLTTQVQYSNKSISLQLWHLQRYKKHFWTSRHQKKNKGLFQVEKELQQINLQSRTGKI